MRAVLSASTSHKAIKRGLLPLIFSGYACLVMTVSGCATDPYVTLPKPETSHLDYNQGVDYANSARLAYQNSLSKMAKDKSFLSNALIVLGGAGVGMVTGGAHRSALGYTALVGGTAYTLGTWNASQSRENAYFEGIKAMDCVLTAAEPLNVSDNSRKTLSNDISLLSDATLKLENSIASVEIASTQLPKTSVQVTRRVKTAVNIVRSIMDTANETYVAALQVERMHDNAGLSIFNTVNRLNTLVNQAIQGTIPDLSALPSIIKGLAATSDIFVPGAGLAESLSKITVDTAQPVAAGDAAPSLVSNNLTTALYDRLELMKTQAATVASLSQRIRLQIQSTQSTQAVEKMRTCGIEIDLEIQVNPNQLTFMENQGTTKYLIISGGKKPYTAAILDKPSPITVTPPFPAGDSKVEVVSSTSTKAGDSYTVFIQDAAGKTKTIPVTIHAPTP